jgi:hypothetical protein
MWMPPHVHYDEEVNHITLMTDFPTLQSKDGTMCVGFYPVIDSTRYTLKVLTWKGLDSISTKLLTNRDAKREIQDRLYHDYVITGDNINSAQVYHIAAC